jgi:hypothetical protein
MKSHTPYTKIVYRGLMDLSYGRSRFFTFLFFMLKYQESDYVSITKVVVFSTTSPTKLSLHFYDFSTIFYAFYKFQQIGYTIEDALLRLDPWKELGPSNWVPRPKGRRLAGIRRHRRRSRSGEGSGSTTCSPRVRWWP